MRIGSALPIPGRLTSQPSNLYLLLSARLLLKEGAVRVACFLRSVRQTLALRNSLAVTSLCSNCEAFFTDTAVAHLFGPAVLQADFASLIH